MKKEQRKYRVRHVLMCEVSTWRVVEASNMDEAMQKAALIQTLTDTSDGGDYEILSDGKVKQLMITEVV